MIVDIPYPDVSQAVVLPNPNFGDTVNQDHQLRILRAMDGTLKTHVKGTDKRTFTYQFDRISRQKCLEFLDAFFLHSEKQWRITDHNNEKIVGYILTNPIVLNQFIYDPYCLSNALGSRESATLSFDFEGEIQ